MEADYKSLYKLVQENIYKKINILALLFRDYKHSDQNGQLTPGLDGATTKN